MKAFVLAPCAALALLAAPADAQSLGNIINPVLGNRSTQNYNGYNNQYGYGQQTYDYPQGYAYQQPYAAQRTYRYGRRYSRRYAQPIYGSYGARSYNRYVSDQSYDRYSSDDRYEGRHHHGRRNYERHEHGDEDNSRDD